MKKLTNRTKILLGLAGLVIVVVVAGLVLLGPSETGLFGATALAITPSDSTITVGATQGLSVNSVYKCNWFTSDAAIVSFVGGTTEVKTVSVKGNARGTATIEARCGLVNLNHVTTSVTVDAVAPIFNTLTITPDQPQTCPKGIGYVKLTAQKTGFALNCTWSTSDSYYVTLSSSTATTTKAVGQHTGAATVTATCNGETASVWVTVVDSTQCGGIIR